MAVEEVVYQAFEERFGEAPNHFASHGWDAISLLVKAIEDAQDTKPDAIAAALNAISGFAGADGIFNYSPTNHDGLAVDDLIMVEIEDASWVLAQ